MLKVLICCDYCAPYEGSFVQSISKLNEIINDFYTITYAFPNGKDLRFIEWMSVFKNGKNIFFYEPNDYNDLYDKISDDFKVVYLHFFPIEFARKIAKNNYNSLVVLHGHHKPILKLWRCCVEYLNSINKRYNNLFIIACSKGVNDKYKLLAKRKNVVTIENCIDFERLDHLIYLTQKRNNNEEYIISIFGGELYTKGVDIACKALKVLNNSSTRLNIYCSHNKNIVYEYVSNNFRNLNISVLDSDNNPCSIYLNSDLFLAPSRFEGFNYSILECMYCNTPVIASNIKEHHHYANRYIFFRKNNYHDLAKKIKIVMNNPPLFNNKELIVEHYRIDNWVNSIASFLNTIIKGQ